MASLATPSPMHTSLAPLPQHHLNKPGPPADAAPSDPPTPSSIASSTERRGRLKRRRMSSHSPPRTPAPSRGHERNPGSPHKHHHRKHHRAESSVSISPPPLSAAKMNRRRSDAEPDHTLRGRARNRSESRSRSPRFEGDEVERKRGGRKRDQPPSRGRNGEACGGDIDREGDDGAVRRQRSLRNMYELEQEQGCVGKRKDSLGVGGKKTFREDGEGRLAPMV